MRSLLTSLRRHSAHVAFVSMCVAVFGVAEARGQVAPPQRVASQTDSSAEAPLTNAAVVKLVRARFSEKTVIAIIRTRPVRFDLSPDRLIELKKNGVGERIILTMLARGDGGDVFSASDDAAGDAFGDDPFFDGMRGQKRSQEAKPNGQSDPNETNIFGSSGGVRGRSRSNIGGGAAEGDSQTTGSASVRILRPPAEAGGGAEPKLERTPTLTNDSVIELVEAGFSEGTIIRRIESSPVEFDFAPAKLAELRRRRVGEPIINAMRAAMSEEGTATGAVDANAKP
ncbi:MAG TPA: hypothetical protein VJ842_04690 [Pyrinomonadaceae bacterium]|nr:hypothetical protein [Pyrinomonadaceae bacterium]